jgi:nucleotide-binding universal stress UspA family protein
MVRDGSDVPWVRAMRLPASEVGGGVVTSRLWEGERRLFLPLGRLHERSVSISWQAHCTDHQQTRGERGAMMTKLFRRILVPHDFSIQATAVLRIAIDVAAEHQGRVTVLHVVPPSSAASQIALTSRAELRAGLRKQLETEVAGAFRKDASRVDCAVVIGEPVRAILAAARQADLIVLATLGRTGLAHLLLGSVAEKVVRLSPVPVLTVRSARKASRSSRAPQKSIPKRAG